jgi:hypothetical protein
MFGEGEGGCESAQTLSCMPPNESKNKVKLKKNLLKFYSTLHKNIKDPSNSLHDCNV